MMPPILTNARGVRFSFTLWVYLSKEFLFSFAVAFTFFFFVFFVNQLLLLAEEVLSYNVPIWGLIRLIFYALPTIIALSVPFAALVGCLMAVGRLSSESEIVSLRATGFSLWFIVFPFLVWGALLSVFSFFVNDYLLPRGTYQFINLYIEIFFSHPELELKPHSVKRYQDDIIITGGIEDSIIEDITIIGPNEEGDYRVIAARAAEITNPDPNLGLITLRLNDVFMHAASRDRSDYYSITEAANMEYNFLIKDIARSSIRDVGPREMSSTSVWEEIQEKEKKFNTNLNAHEASIERLQYQISMSYYHQGKISASLQEDISTSQPTLSRNLSLKIYYIEYYKKFSLPFAAVCFIFLAFPMGLFSNRSGRSVGFGIGLLIASFYWGLLVTGQSLGAVTNYLDPFIAMWFPNLLVIGLGIIVFIMKIRK